MSTHRLAAPWPYYGGKRHLAARIWTRLGRVDHYVEPFFGSGAVLLGRPLETMTRQPPTETVNDINGFVANFWRAAQADPDAVAAAADRPVCELTLHAVHDHLLALADGLAERLRADHTAYDAEIAGLWAWGASCWVGGGWGAIASPRRPALGQPHGHGLHPLRARDELLATLRALRVRQAHPRVLCGDWSRVVTTAALWQSERYQHRLLAGVYLDPPYDPARRTGAMYASGDTSSVADDVRAWCLEHGAAPGLRIVLSGLVGEHDALLAHGWTVEQWTSPLGKPECVWYSPHCVSSAPLLDLLEGA